MALAFLNGSLATVKAADEGLLRSLIERSVKEIEIPEGVTNIGRGAFSYCIEIKRLEIPEGVKVIGQDAFKGCTSVKEIVLPKSLESIDRQAMMDCANLERIVLPPKVSVVPITFASSCWKMTEFIAEGNIVDINGYAFQYCNTCMKYDFTHCTSVPYLKQTTAFINIPADSKILVPAALYDQWVVATNWAEFADHIVAVAEGSEGLAYELKSGGDEYMVVGMGSCTDTHLVIPSTHEGLPVSTVDMSAFYNCAEIESVTIPDNVYVSWSAFQDCTGLKEVIFKGDNVTLGGSAFAGCVELESIKLPGGTTSVGWLMFDGCVSLRLIDCTALSQVPELNYEDSIPMNEGLIIKVPASLYDEWVVATNWALYADCIVAV